MRALVIEDDIVSRTLLKSLLKEYGECDEAADGKEAVELFKESFNNLKIYDLVCLDIMLPEMGGMDVLKIIRETEKQNGVSSFNGVKILMITALDDSRNILDAFKYGCEGYLVKPIIKAKLDEELKKLEILK